MLLKISLKKNAHLIPKNFEDKKIKIIEYLILKGGKEYKEVDIIFEEEMVKKQKISNRILTIINKKYQMILS